MDKAIKEIEYTIAGVEGGLQRTQKDIDRAKEYLEEDRKRLDRCQDVYKEQMELLVSLQKALAVLKEKSV